ncbi:MAG: hypothetical protein J5X21_21110 [Candidatus Accumulibacter sp.]|nr:hypothetical protein [Candidatus Accumulibacter conexus]
MIGVTVVLAVLALMAMAPSLKAMGVDSGMALASHINIGRVTKLSPSTRETVLGVRGYLFIDLDAGKVLHKQPGMVASQVACETLARSVSAAQYANLACGDNRDTNRLLLAEALAKSYALGAKAVVIDVELSSTAHGIRPEEDVRLRQVLASNSLVPTFFVLATEPAPSGDDARLVATRLRLPEPPFAASPTVAGLPVLMTPDFPARSFPSCYTLVDSAQLTETSVMSLPRAVVAVMAGTTTVQTAATNCSSAATGYTRIVYTLPSSNVDLDRATYSAQQSTLVELQFKLSGLYDRCLLRNKHLQFILYERNPDV